MDDGRGARTSIDILRCRRWLRAIDHSSSRDME